MNAADRTSYAIRVFAVASLLALAGVFGFARVLGNDVEALRLVFWCGVFGVVVACVSASFAFVATRTTRYGWVLAALVGTVAGILFTTIAMWPSGLWPGGLDTPVLPIWAAASGFGFFAASLGRYASAADADYSEFRVGAEGLLFAVGVLMIVKGGLNHLGPRMNFARDRTVVEKPLNELRSAARDQFLANSCADSMPWRTILDPDVAIDSAIVLTPAGVYASEHAYDAPQRGRILSLWAAGDRMFGIVETWIGEDAPMMGIIEAAYMHNFDQLWFRVAYEDEFADTFHGRALMEGVSGRWRTGDSRCTGRMLTNEDVQLPRNATASAQQASATLREWARSYAHIYHRSVRPMRALPVPKPDPGVMVADETLSALAISAQFATENGMRVALDSTTAIDLSANLTLGGVTIARAVDPATRIANWLVVGPMQSLITYRGSVEALRRDGSFVQTQFPALRFPQP